MKKLGLSARYIGAGDTVTAQLPEAGESVPGDSQLLVYLGENAPENTVIVPDFTGMNRQQASDNAGILGLYVLVTGNPEIAPGILVTSQNIAAGTQVPQGTTITLEFTDTSARD